MTTASIKSGESLNIGLYFKDDYQLPSTCNLIVYIGGVCVGNLFTQKPIIEKIDNKYSIKISSSDTFRMRGYRDLIVVLDDPDGIGNKKTIVGGINFDRFSDEFSSESKGNSYNILIEIELSISQYIGDIKLVNFFKGDKGDKGDTGNYGVVEFVVNENMELEQHTLVGEPLDFALVDGELKLTETEQVVNLGKVGIIPKGEWSNLETYRKFDLVTNAGSSYLSLKDENVSDLTVIADWQLMAIKGIDGYGAVLQELGLSETGVMSQKAVTDEIAQLAGKLGANATFKGIAFPSTNPGTPDGPQFYIASTDGVYSNFGGLSLSNGVHSLSYKDGSWSVNKIVTVVQEEGQSLNQFMSQKAITDSLNSIISSVFDIYTSKNLFDKNAISTGTYLNTSTGGLLSNEGFWTSDYILVEYALPYFVNPSFSFICFFDAEKKFISGIGAPGQTLITIPAKGRYIRISNGNSSLISTIVEQGSSHSGYAAYLKRYTPKFLGELLTFENKLFEVSNLSNPILESDNGSASGVLGAVVDLLATEDGYLNRLEGDFDNAGTCKISIFKDKTLISGSYYKFTKVQDFTLTVPASGYNSFDLFREKIEIKAGYYLGVQRSSTSQPKYGLSTFRGFGWYQQINSDIDTETSCTYVDDAGFAFNYSIANNLYAEVGEVYNKQEFQALIYEFNTSNELKNATGGASVLLMNNVANVKKGLIYSLTITSLDAGTATFQILERLSFNYPNPSAGNQDSFEAVSSFEIDILVGTHEYILPFEVEIGAGQYLAWAAGTGTPRATTGALNDGGWWQGGDGPVIGTRNLIYQPYPIGFKYTVKSSLFATEIPEVEYVEIEATRNIADFNSIREIIEGITDAGPYKQYTINVPNGSWFECDLIGKDYVEIKGQDKYLTILYCDGTSTKITPSDYSFPLYASTQLSSVPQQYKHCFNARKNLKVSNLTVNVNDCKYCFHLDSNTGNNLIEIYNSRMYTAANVNFCIGIGLNGGQAIIIKECEFERSTSGLNAIFFHNANNQNKPCSLTIENSDFKNCNYLLLDELGSEQEDVVKLINCRSDINASVTWTVDYKSNELTYWVNPATGLNEPNPQNVPYCIKLNFSGTQITGMSSTVYPYGGYGDSRPNFQDYINGDLYNYQLVKNTSAPATITSGGSKGEIRIDGNYIYVCISTNNWKRAPLLTW